MPKKRVFGKTGFRKLIEKRIGEYKGYGSDARFYALIGDAQDYLIEKYFAKKVSRAELQNIKQLEAQTLVLKAARDKIANNLPLTVGTAKKLFEILLHEIPQYVQVHEARLPRPILRQLESMREYANDKLKILARLLGNELIVGPDSEYILRCFELHQNIISIRLKENYGTYLKYFHTLNRSMDAIDKALSKKRL